VADEPEFKPFIKPEESIAEFTLKAVMLGVVLAAVLTAANVYLGLLAGMTVSASIPAAVISMGILRGLLKKGTILENNIVQTMASAGESIAAGIIFTIPALVILGIWKNFQFWPTFFVGVLGGFLGILFMIPLRKVLIVEEKELTYPEGVACAEILETGQKGGVGVKYIFSAMGLGGLIGILQDFGMLTKKAAYTFSLGRFPFQISTLFSTALVGIGYIIGLNIALLVFIGGAIAWFVGVPAYLQIFSGPDLTTEIAAAAVKAKATVTSAFTASYIWGEYIRKIGVGAMVIGGFWSIWRMRGGIMSGLGEISKAFKKSGSDSEKVKRTDRNMPMNAVVPLICVTSIAIFFLYWYFTGSVGTALLCSVLMLVAGFFFVAVSSYIVGLVGSTNNPVSGMIIFTLLFSALLLFYLGITGTAGMLAALIVAGVVCCAACAAGDMSQDLKTGYLVGATPAKMQIGQIIGVVVASLVTAPIMTLLHTTRGIGVVVKEGVEPLAAPQAGIFRDIVNSVFSQNVPWGLLGIGALLAILIIVLDEIARKSNSTFRLHVMPVAIGLYLPFYLTVPILLGGIVKMLFSRKSKSKAGERGVLFASGLIAGEAIMGIIFAALVFFIFTGDREVPVIIKLPYVKNILATVAVLGVAAILAFLALSKPGEKNPEG
jgi:putative OPT family oligopeptide transporter